MRGIFFMMTFCLIKVLVKFLEEGPIKCKDIPPAIPARFGTQRKNISGVLYILLTLP